MSAAACFRCDWQGSTHGRACPRCGAPLYRQPAQAEPFRDDVDPARDANRPPRRSLPPGVSIVFALVLALAVVAAIQRVPERTTPAPVSSPSDDRPAADALDGTGALVYLAGSEGERPSLWVVDLHGGGAGPGPAVPGGTSELVDLSGAEPGWIGIERAGRDGVSAAVVRGMGADAEIVGLGHGDLVAWGPGGTSLVFARNGHPTRRGCAPVRISLVTIASSREAWALNDPGFCGPVLSLSRSSAATYFTAASGDRLSVYLTGAVGVPHLMFDGLGVLSAAPPGAFLLSRDSAEQTLGQHRGRGGTLLGWKGIGGPVAVGNGEDVLTVERILAWSTDGSRAALVGRLGDRRGVFVVPAGSGLGPRVPRYVMPAARVRDATFGPLGPIGPLYLTTNEGILVDHAGSLAPLAIPADAPPPAGPVVWVP